MSLANPWHTVPARVAYARAERRVEDAEERYRARPTPKHKAELEAADAAFIAARDALEALEPHLFDPFGDGTGAGR